MVSGKLPKIGEPIFSVCNLFSDKIPFPLIKVIKNDLLTTFNRLHKNVDSTHEECPHCDENNQEEFHYES